MIVWLWIIRVINSIFLALITWFVYNLFSYILGYGSKLNLNLDGMDVYHRTTLIIITFIAFVFMLLVYPICSYLEKKLKD